MNWIVRVREKDGLTYICMYIKPEAKYDDKIITSEGKAAEGGLLFQLFFLLWGWSPESSRQLLYIRHCGYFISGSS